MSYLLQSIRERRDYERTRLSGHVYMAWSGRSNHRCRVIDLSRGGVFLDAGTLPIPDRAVVELTFVVPSGPVVQLIRRAALVVRRVDTRLGLRFVRRRAPTQRP
jgi:hypothetical protein